SPRACWNARWRGGGTPDSRKARKIGGSSVPEAKNLRKIEGFRRFCPLHPHPLLLSLITFKAWTRWSSEAENSFDGKRGAKRYGRIIRRNIANVRMTQTQLVRSLA